MPFKLLWLTLLHYAHCISGTCGNDRCCLQAYAALYAWDLTYRLDQNPFKKCPSSTVLSTLRKYATDFKLREHTHFGCTVTSINEMDGRCLLSAEICIVRPKIASFNFRFLSQEPAFCQKKIEIKNIHCISCRLALQKPELSGY